MSNIKQWIDRNREIRSVVKSLQRLAHGMGDVPDLQKRIALMGIDLIHVSNAIEQNITAYTNKRSEERGAKAVAGPR